MTLMYKLKGKVERILDFAIEKTVEKTANTPLGYAYTFFFERLENIADGTTFTNQYDEKHQSLTVLKDGRPILIVGKKEKPAYIS